MITSPSKLQSSTDPLPALFPTSTQQSRIRFNWLMTPGPGKGKAIKEQNTGNGDVAQHVKLLAAKLASHLSTGYSPSCSTSDPGPGVWALATQVRDQGGGWGEGEF